MVSSIIQSIRDVLGSVAQLPGWFLYCCAPALLIITGFILALVHADRAYPTLALFLGGVGMFLVASIAETFTDFVVWAAIYLAVTALVRLFFYIPFPKRKKAKNRNEDIYEAFHADLDIGKPVETELPPVLSAEEGELQLKHVDQLIEKLRTAELDPVDRLELDAVARSLDDYRGRALSAGEARALNDCLSAVLKLTAKYSL